MLYSFRKHFLKRCHSNSFESAVGVLHVTRFLFPDADIGIAHKPLKVTVPPTSSEAKAVMKWVWCAEDLLVLSSEETYNCKIPPWFHRSHRPKECSLVFFWLCGMWSVLMLCWRSFFLRKKLRSKARNTSHICLLRKKRYSPLPPTKKSLFLTPPPTPVSLLSLWLCPRTLSLHKSWVILTSWTGPT